MVILDHKDYQQMCLKLLEDTSCYEILHTDSTPENKKILLEVLGQPTTNGLISLEELDFLIPNSPRIATFYSLPKVHK